MIGDGGGGRHSHKHKPIGTKCFVVGREYNYDLQSTRPHT